MFDFLPNYYTTYLDATITTLKVSLIALLVGLILGIVVCLAKISTYKVFNILATIYVEIIRNTPILVQIMIIYFALPEVGISFTPFMSAIIALSINSGAYVSEIFRSGILAIDKGQMEACLSLGMTRAQALKRVVLPQAFRIAIPPLGNIFVDTVKGSSLAFTLGVVELLAKAQMEAAASYKFFESYVVVAIMYWIIIGFFNYLQKILEKKLSVY